MWKRLFGASKKQQALEQERLYLEYRSKNGMDNFEERYFSEIMELKKFMENISESEYYICISILAGNIDFGNFHLWVKDNICKARLDQHCEHHFPELGLPEIYYSDPPTREPVQFFDGYEVPAIETLSYEDAMEIIYSWLDGGWNSWML